MRRLRTNYLKSNIVALRIVNFRSISIASGNFFYQKTLRNHFSIMKFIFVILFDFSRGCLPNENKIRFERDFEYRQRFESLTDEVFNSRVTLNLWQANALSRMVGFPK